MDNLEDRTGKVIVKSIFKSNYKVKNCLINNWCKVYECESMHHVETALLIMKKIDDKSLSSLRKEQKYYDSLKSKVIKANSASQVKRVADSDLTLWVGNYSDSLNIDHYKDKLLKRIDERLSQAKEVYGDTFISKFEKVNRNKGYDAAEYLVIYNNTIAIESGHVVYNPHIRYRDELLEMIDCHQEKSDDGYWTLIKNTEEWKEDYVERTRKSLLLSHWAITDDIFHCPDGFTRYGYLQWREKCEKVGLDPDKIRSRH